MWIIQHAVILCITKAATPTGMLLALNNVVPAEPKKKYNLHSITTRMGTCCKKLQVPQTPFRQTCSLLKFCKIYGFLLKMYHCKLEMFWLTTCREVITANPTCQTQGTTYLIQCTAVTIGVYSQHLKVVELVSFGLLTWVMTYKYTVYCILKFRCWNWKQYVLNAFLPSINTKQNECGI